MTALSTIAPAMMEPRLVLCVQPTFTKTPVPYTGGHFLRANEPQGGSMTGTAATLSIVVSLSCRNAAGWPLRADDAVRCIVDATGLGSY